MKTTKIIYYTSTGLFSAMLTLSGIMHITHNPKMVEGMSTLGYPAYFMTILGLAKLLGVVAIWQNILPLAKEWAYAGFTILLVGAAWSHAQAGQLFIMPVVLLGALATSYYFNYKLSNKHNVKAAL